MSALVFGKEEPNAYSSTKNGKWRRALVSPNEDGTWTLSHGGGTTSPVGAGVMHCDSWDQQVFHTEEEAHEAAQEWVRGS